MRTAYQSAPLEIKLGKHYLNFKDFADIEASIEDALSNNKQVILDFAQVREGVRSDFYGRLLAKIQNFYATEAEAFDFLRHNLLLRFESKSSKAYEKLTQGFDMFFNVDFHK